MKRKKLNKRIFSILRILVSVSLLSFLIVKNIDNLREIQKVTRQLNISWLVLAALFYFLSIVFILFRWEVLLKAKEVSVPRRFLLQSVLIGFFYNNLLPTSVGGDAYRVYDIHTHKGVSLYKGIASVSIERFTSIVVGCLFVFAFVILDLVGYFEHDFVTSAMIAAILVVVGGVVFLISALINPYIFKIDVLFRKFKILSKIRPQVKKFQETFSSYWKDKKKALVMCLLYNFLVHVLVTLSYYFASMTVGLGLRFISFLFILPFSAMVANLPISIGGLGVRENTLAFILSLIGISESKAAIFSFLVLFIVLFNALIGGLVYLFKNIFFSTRRSTGNLPKKN
ncbi:MAG: flippase-like domain-containing protein [Actinobacteria bacterium]|nr:flippase-like domain-containing protein [Actinomycetota bacterium]